METFKLRYDTIMFSPTFWELAPDPFLMDKVVKMCYVSLRTSIFSPLKIFNTNVIGFIHCLTGTLVYLKFVERLLLGTFWGFSIPRNLIALIE